MGHAYFRTSRWLLSWPIRYRSSDFDLSDLAEAKIKVNTTVATDIPQVIHLKFNRWWLTIQLIPLYTVQSLPPPNRSALPQHQESEIQVSNKFHHKLAPSVKTRYSPGFLASASELEGQRPSFQPPTSKAKSPWRYQADQHRKRVHWVDSRPDYYDNLPPMQVSSVTIFLWAILPIQYGKGFR